jgi:hypothetical protein
MNKCKSLVLLSKKHSMIFLIPNIITGRRRGRRGSKLQVSGITTDSVVPSSKPSNTALSPLSQLTTTIHHIIVVFVAKTTKLPLLRAKSELQNCTRFWAARHNFNYLSGAIMSWIFRHNLKGKKKDHRNFQFYQGKKNLGSSLTYKMNSNDFK